MPRGKYFHGSIRSSGILLATCRLVALARDLWRLCADRSPGWSLDQSLCVRDEANGSSANYGLVKDRLQETSFATSGVANGEPCFCPVGANVARRRWPITKANLDQLIPVWSRRKFSAAMDMPEPSPGYALNQWVQGSSHWSVIPNTTLPPCF